MKLTVRTLWQVVVSLVALGYVSQPARAQVKVYRGEGTGPGVEFRVLRALRSLNHVEPLVAPTGPIPGARAAVLDGSAGCSG